MACSAISIVITNAGSSDFNGTYTLDGTDNGFNRYTKDGGTYILEAGIAAGPGLYWKLRKIGNGGFYYANQGGTPSECPPASLPLIVQQSSFPSSYPSFGAPDIALVSTPAQNTFGLPADVVALITARFGTVANFLRLRNLGQV